MKLGENRMKERRKRENRGDEGLNARSKRGRKKSGKPNFAVFCVKVQRLARSDSALARMNLSIGKRLVPALLIGMKSPSFVIMAPLVISSRAFRLPFLKNTAAGLYAWRYEVLASRQRE